MENINLKDIEEGLKLLENKRKAETLSEEISEEKQGVWASVMKSKHFDLVKTLLISFVLAVICYQMPNIYFQVLGKENINADFANMVQMTSFAAFKFFVARLVVDTSFYFNEHKFYVFIKRNGNLAFDYQENLIELDKWQQTKITTLKYIAYLFLFAFLLQA